MKVFTHTRTFDTYVRIYVVKEDNFCAGHVLYPYTSFISLIYYFLREMLKSRHMILDLEFEPWTLCKMGLTCLDLS